MLYLNEKIAIKFHQLKLEWLLLSISKPLSQSYLDFIHVVINISNYYLPKYENWVMKAICKSRH